MKDKLRNYQAIPLACLFRNRLPECSRCIGGHFLADNLTKEIYCVNCGFYYYYGNRKNGHKRLSVSLPLTKSSLLGRKYSLKKERRYLALSIAQMRRKWYTVPEIAERLCISEREVYRIYRKHRKENRKLRKN